MKFKLFFLFLMSCFMPALGMEEHLNAETIVNHPKFIIAKQAFEKVGGSIAIWPNKILIKVKLPSCWKGQYFDFNALNFWQKLDKFYHECVIWKTHPSEYLVSLQESLEGRCILNIAKRYQMGDELAIAKFNELPESAKALVLKLQGRF